MTSDSLLSTSAPGVAMNINTELSRPSISATQNNLLNEICPTSTNSVLSSTFEQVLAALSQQVKASPDSIAIPNTNILAGTSGVPLWLWEMNILAAQWGLEMSGNSSALINLSTMPTPLQTSTPLAETSASLTEVKAVDTSENSGNPHPSQSIAAALQRAGEKYGLPLQLLPALATAESGMNPTAVSPAGALGLMQLMPATAAALGVKNPLDPLQSIEGSAQYMHQLLTQFGQLPLALAAYNAGPGAVRAYGGIPPFGETQSYVSRVLSLMGIT